MLRKGRKPFRIATAAAALALAAVAIGCNSEGQSETAPAPAVLTLGERDVATAESIRMEAGVPISGTLEPFRTAEVKAQISGIITGVRGDAGSAVSRGAPMGVIVAEGTRSQVTSARAGISAAEANLSLARQRMESMKSLYEAGAVAKIEYDNSRVGVEAAQAQLTAARAQATGASEQAGRATVSSPLSGTISERFVNEGEAVNPGQRLFTVVNASTLELAGQIPIDQRKDIYVGQPVTLTLSADPTRPVRGTVARIEPVADNQTRQVGVYVQVVNPNGAIVAGQFANGTILTEGVKVETVVPIAAVRQNGEKTFALVVVNGTIAERAITVGLRDEAKGVVAIASGINPGERVITAPTMQVTPGTQVRLAGERAGATTDSSGRKK